MLPAIRLHGHEQRVFPLNGDWLTELDVITAVRKSGVRTLKYFLTPETHPEPVRLQERLRSKALDTERARTGYILYIDGETADAETIEQHLSEINPGYAHLRASEEIEPLAVRQASIVDQTRGKPVRITVADFSHE